MIVLLIITRDQADLLRLNIEHHLGWGFDHVGVADNGSTDGTPELLREYGDAVSTLPAPVWIKRGSVFAELFDAVEERHGPVSWAAHSDTDEFWWDAEADLRTLLDDVPEDLYAVNFEQKLFLSTELDAPSGPAYNRRIYRASGEASPLFTSHLGGKSFYRGEWLRGFEINHSHWMEELPHPVWRHTRLPLLHYMIEDEQDFLRKVKTLPVVHAAIPEPGLPGDPSFLAASYKYAWWAIYQREGEEGLRRYYREQYVLTAAAVTRHVDAGELIEDTAFARHKSPVGLTSPRAVF